MQVSFLYAVNCLTKSIWESAAQVPGGYQDSMSKNTQLGKALDDACKELDTLGDLVSLHRP